MCDNDTDFGHVRVWRGVRTSHILDPHRWTVKYTPPGAHTPRILTCDYIKTAVAQRMAVLDMVPLCATISGVGYRYAVDRSNDSRYRLQLWAPLDDLFDISSYGYTPSAT